MRINLKCTVPSVVSHCVKAIDCTFLFIWNSGKDRLQTVSRSVVARGLERRVKHVKQEHF